MHGLSSERWDHLLVFPRDHYDPSHESDIRHASAPIAPRVDVHANSLTSPIADAERRRQWEECKKNFLSVDSKVSDTVLTTSSEDKESRTHAGTVADAYEAVEQMDAAETTSTGCSPWSTVTPPYDVRSSPSWPRISPGGGENEVRGPAD